MQSQGPITQSDLKNRLIEKGIDRWDQLNENQQAILQRIWKVITYKWQWQIMLNSPFLLIWVFDKSIPAFHKFNVSLVASLPLPEWVTAWLNFS